MNALTPNEISAVYGVEERRIRKEVEHGVLHSSKPLRLDYESVVYLLIVADLGVELGVDDRRKLFGLVSRALRSRKARPSTIALSPIVEIKIGRLVDEAEARFTRFEAWKRKIVVDDGILGGEPVFPKSRLAVRHVGAMVAKGEAARAELREDYPYLREEDLDFAVMYTKAYPRMGRPREHLASSG